MNDVSGLLDAAQRPSAAAPARDDMAAFSSFDPVLAALQKQYADARQMRRRAESEYGALDGMTMLAADVEDSAWCAVQTRYLELRADRAALARANDIIEEAVAKARREEEREAREETLRLFERMQWLMRLEEARAQRALYVFALMILMGENRPVFRAHSPALCFNRLAA